MVKQSLNTYNVTENLSIQLVEIPKIQNVPKCNYCGKSKGNFCDETWPSALALSKYLAKELPLKRLEDCQALVIGCGIGLEGLVLAKLGANVTFLGDLQLKTLFESLVQFLSPANAFIHRSMLSLLYFPIKPFQNRLILHSISPNNLSIALLGPNETTVYLLKRTTLRAHGYHEPPSMNILGLSLIQI